MVNEVIPFFICKLTIALYSLPLLGYTKASYVNKATTAPFLDHGGSSLKKKGGKWGGGLAWLEFEGVEGEFYTDGEENIYYKKGFQ
jgi:hypothetical protein